MTAVNWLIEQLTYKSKEKFFNSWQEDADLTELFEQAKQMEKQQIINSFDYGIENYNDCKIFDGKQYYNETYGSGVLTEGSGAVGDKGGAVTSSQTEISDEEIKNAALKEYNNNDYQYKHWEIDAWISACKWYREQLKKET